VALQKRLKEIHSLALDKKSLSSVVGSAIDLSKAHGKQVLLLLCFHRMQHLRTAIIA
jgi:hypothetical protein